MKNNNARLVRALLHQEQSALQTSIDRRTCSMHRRGGVVMNRDAYDIPEMCDVLFEGERAIWLNSVEQPSQFGLLQFEQFNVQQVGLQPAQMSPENRLARRPMMPSKTAYGPRPCGPPRSRAFP